MNVLIQSVFGFFSKIIDLNDLNKRQSLHSTWDNDNDQTDLYRTIAMCAGSVNDFLNYANDHAFLILLTVAV